MNRSWFLILIMTFSAGQICRGEVSQANPTEDVHTFWTYCEKPVRIVSIGFKAQDQTFMETVEQEARRGADLIVLTECWADKKLFTPEELFFKPMAELARKYNTYIVSPVYRLKDNTVFNTAIVYDRQGQIIGTYDKVQPVLSDPPGRGGEGPQFLPTYKTVMPGDDAPVFETDFGRVGVAICFDAQFPEVWQRLADNGAELVLFSSAYSAGRSLGAYATLHHYYVVSATWNRECQVYDITGDPLLDEREGISRVVLDMGRIMLHNNDSYNYAPPYDWSDRFGKINMLLKENPGVIMEKRQDREDWHVVKAIEPGVNLRSLLKKYDIQDIRTYLNKQRRQADQLRGFKFNRVGPETGPAGQASLDLRSFEMDGRSRLYYLYLPENLPKNAPLVFVFHGYGGTAKGMIPFSNMNPVADKHGFAVCYPQAVFGDDKKNSWNAGYSNPGVDDVKFLSSLAKHLHEAFNLSPENTFCTGMSNGADICYVLACQSPDVFSAIAPVAGCMMESTFNACQSEKPVSVFEIHGTDDTITRWRGDAEYSEEYGGYKSVPDTIKFWVKKNGCTKLTTETLPDVNTDDKSTVVCEKYLNAVSHNEVWLYKLVGGGHDWPGASGNKDIVAAEEIWHFFKRFID